MGLEGEGGRKEGEAGREGNRWMMEDDEAGKKGGNDKNGNDATTGRIEKK